MNQNIKVASSLIKLAKELMAVDFPTQEAMDKYLKDHPDADRSNHKVVKTESKTEDHPYNQHQKRLNEHRENEIKKHLGKKPTDELSHEDIQKFHESGGSNKVDWHGKTMKTDKVTGPKKTLTKEEHTHSFGKLNKDDEDETRVRVYDSGPDKGMDRYSVVIDGKDWKNTANPGFVPMIGLDEGGRGISQFSEGKEGKHLGKPVKWEDLSKDTQDHIKQRLSDSGK
jgi:hypothetical protein